MTGLEKHQPASTEKTAKRSRVTGGKRVAAAAVIALGAAYKFAILTDLLKTNPTKGVERFQTVRRERFLSEREVAAISEALALFERDDHRSGRLRLMLQVGRAATKPGFRNAGFSISTGGSFLLSPRVNVSGGDVARVAERRIPTASAVGAAAAAPSPVSSGVVGAGTVAGVAIDRVGNHASSDGGG